MRTIYDPENGTNVTSTVVAALRTSRTLVSAYLFRFQCINFWTYNPDGNYVDFTFTDATWPIFVNKYQVGPSGIAQLGPYSSGNLQPDGLTFTPERMTIDKLEYGIGFEDHPVEVTWGYNDANSYVGSQTTPFSNAVNPANLTLRMAMCLGGFQECPFWIHAAIYSDFPKNGGTFLGTTLMFRGFIRKVDSTRSVLKIGISSLMDVFQQVKIPTQVITPNNRATPFLPAAANTVAGGATVDNLTVLTPTSIQLASTFGTFSFARDSLKDCWCSFQPFIDLADYPDGLLPAPGLPPSPLWRIEGNDAASGSTANLYFYEPPVIPPNSYVTFNIFGQNPFSGGAPGFPNVPPPEYSA